MKIIEPKKIEDSVIIAKTKLLDFTNNVTNLVSLLGVSAIISPIDNKFKNIIYLFIIGCIIYSSMFGNKTATTIIDSRKKLGGLFDVKKQITSNEILIKVNNNELNTIKEVLQ